MTTENIDIRIREDGAVVVRRNIESIAPAADKSANAVDFLKKALGALGGALAAREALRLADTYTNLQNRLRATGLEGENLKAVYDSLLKASNDTRSSLEGSVELYSRLAISSKELGVSQKQLIDFTKSLNQAILLSGASAQEAQAGLIQLSQGMASGVLRGDELRSVMEQLPAVADVIAKQMGVTRGELRKLGEEGKITAQTILKAFQGSREELEKRFATTVPTLSQSFQVLRNNVLNLIGTFDTSTGVTGALSQAIFALARNIDTVARALVSLAAGLVLVGGTAALIRGLGAAFNFLTAAIAANPIGALLVVLTSAITALTLFRDKILLGIDGVTTLGDLFRAFGETVGPAFSKLGDYIAAFFGPLNKLAKDWLGSVEFSVAGILRAVAKTADFFINSWRGAVYATVAIFEGVPPALKDLFLQALNFILSAIGNFVNKAGELLSTVTEFAGLGKIATNLDFTLPNDVEGAAGRLGKDIGTAFSEGFNAGGTPAQKFLSDLEARAKVIGAERIAGQKTGVVSDKAGAAAPIKVDAKEIEKATNALRSLLNTIQPSSGAILELAKAQKTLNEAQRLGLITAAENAKYLELARAYYDDIINPLKAYNRELDEQAALLKVSSRDRGVETELLRVSNDLKKQGLPLTAEETKALREKLQAMRDLNEATQAQDALIANSVGARQAYVTQLNAINALLNDPSSGFTPGDASIAVTSMFPDLLSGTQVALDATVAAFQQMYDQIAMMRERNLISANDAAAAEARIAIMYKETQLAGTKDFFSNLAALSTSGNKRLAAIGRAAAVTSATIDGVLAVQKALAAPPGWPYNAPQVISVGIAAAANVAKIAGFEEGGYTGNMGTGQIAGVVHGQEFVANAEATKRNRAALEAMNAGATIGGGEQNVDITIITPPGTTARTDERDTPDGKQIEIRIEEAVVKNVRSGGRIAEAFEGQYGLNRATGSSR